MAQNRVVKSETHPTPPLGMVSHILSGLSFKSFPKEVWGGKEVWVQSVGSVCGSVSLMYTFYSQGMNDAVLQMWSRDMKIIQIK